LVLALLLRPKQKAQLESSPNNELTDRQNRQRPGERIPDIYGTLWATPDLIQLPYKTFPANNTEVEHTVMCLGRGSFSILDVRDGITPVSQIDGTIVEVYAPNTSPNSTVSGTVTNTYNYNSTPTGISAVALCTELLTNRTVTSGLLSFLSTHIIGTATLYIPIKGKLPTLTNTGYIHVELSTNSGVSWTTINSYTADVDTTIAHVLTGVTDLGAVRVRVTVNAVQVEDIATARAITTAALTGVYVSNVVTISGVTGIEPQLRIGTKAINRRIVTVRRSNSVTVKSFYRQTACASLPTMM